MKFTPWGPGFDPVPIEELNLPPEDGLSDEELEARASLVAPLVAAHEEALAARALVLADPLPTIVGGASPFRMIPDGVRTGRIPADWLAEGGVKFPGASCYEADCQPFDCPDCDDEDETEEEEDPRPPIVLAKNTLCKASPFKIEKRIRVDICTRGAAARQVVENNTKKYFGRQIHKALAKCAKPLNDGKCVCAHIAWGMLAQARETHHDGTAWHTVPSILVPTLLDAGVIVRQGSRLVDAVSGLPIITGGVPLTGPDGASGPCAWIYAHGPVDGALSEYQDSSFWDELTNSGLDSGRVFGLVRVDSCGAYAIPVSLACGCGESKPPEEPTEEEPKEEPAEEGGER